MQVHQETQGQTRGSACSLLGAGAGADLMATIPGGTVALAAGGVTGAKAEQAPSPRRHPIRVGMGSAFPAAQALPAPGTAAEGAVLEVLGVLAAMRTLATAAMACRLISRELPYGTRGVAAVALTTQSQRAEPSRAAAMEARVAGGMVGCQEANMLARMGCLIQGEEVAQAQRRAALAAVVATVVRVLSSSNAAIHYPQRCPLLRRRRRRHLVRHQQ